VAIAYQFGPVSSALGYENVAAFGPDGRTNVISMDDDGFTILITTNNHPIINYSNYTYVYIAFR
jgi:hypothetical protein